MMLNSASTQVKQVKQPLIESLSKRRKDLQCKHRLRGWNIIWAYTHPLEQTEPRGNLAGARVGRSTTVMPIVQHRQSL